MRVMTYMLLIIGQSRKVQSGKIKVLRVKKIISLEDHIKKQRKL